MIRFALALAALVLAQDKPVGWQQVQTNMAKLKSYNFTLKGGPDDVQGTFEKGSIYIKGKEVEVAGKGSITHASADGKWTTVSMLQQMGKGGESLKRISKLVPAVDIINTIAQSARKVDGDSIKGFTGDFGQGILAKMVRTPWLETNDLKSASKLDGSFAFSCAEGRVVKAELQIKGCKVEQERRHYQGVPKPGDPPPTPPGPTWRLGNDGYWYEGVEKPITVNYVIELKDFGTAQIPDDVRKPIGLK
jgi:hypothetical protein